MSLYDYAESWTTVIGRASFSILVHLIWWEAIICSFAIFIIFPSEYKNKCHWTPSGFLDGMLDKIQKQWQLWSVAFFVWCGHVKPIYLNGVENRSFNSKLFSSTTLHGKDSRELIPSKLHVSFEKYKNESQFDQI